ncbi:unnamed protein product [marine sediment metagenome]|uniref:Pilus assembly protein PilO n=1 Tax=marine sediment metagenome TaxID=412755 RepID=X1J601_9ZZZZ
MSPKKKIIIFSVIFGVATIAIVGFVIYPLFKGIEKSSEELITAKKELILSKEEAGKFEQFKEIYKGLKPDLEKINQLFIDQEIPIDLIKFWEKEARDSELSIKISPVFLKAAEIDPWNSIGFQLRLIGSFPNFLKFLEKIETSPYLIEIQNLTVEKLVQDVSATLTVKVYTK